MARHRYPGDSMVDTPPPPGVARAGELLCDLLASRPAYRRQWQQHAHRMRQAEISYAAVSQVLALYLWDRGIKRDADKDLPRRLRDRVSRALQSEQLTYETLTWFTEAFDFDPEDRHDVWRAFSGGGPTEDGIAFTMSNPTCTDDQAAETPHSGIIRTLPHRR